MKKQIIYMMGLALAPLFAACSGDYDDWASPQSFAAEQAAAKYGVTFAPGPDANLTLPATSAEVNIVALSSSDARVTNFTAKSVTIDGQEIKAFVSNGNVVVRVSDLSKLVEKEYDSRSAEPRTLKVVSNVAAVLDNGDPVVIDMAGTTEMTFTNAPTPAVDPKGYFLLGDFVENGGGWDTTAPIWMEANGDGTFTATINTKTEGDNWFKFYEGSHYESGNWDEINLGVMGAAVNGDNSLHGFVVYTGDDAAHAPDGVQTPVISGQGTFKVILDMRNLTYTIQRAEAKYYIIGNPNGWGINANCMAYALGGNRYEFTTKSGNQWELKILEGKYLGLGDGAWDHCWGGDDGSTAATGTLRNNNNQGAIGPSESPVWYTLTFNMNDLSYQFEIINEPTVEYTSVSLIGDFNGWGGDLDLEQTAPHNWHVQANIPSDGGLKFRANHDWGTNWGAEQDGVVMGDLYYAASAKDGKNITVPAGTYDFYLNDITGHWNIVKVE